jgi:hypothetical protein
VHRSRQTQRWRRRACCLSSAYLARCGHPGGDPRSLVFLPRSRNQASGAYLDCIACPGNPGRNRRGAAVSNLGSRNTLAAATRKDLTASYL